MSGLLSSQDRESIARLIGELIDYRFYPAVFRSKLLDAFLSLVPVRGPCTVFQLDRFFSEGGKLIDYEHRNLPHPVIVGLWYRHMRRASSIIERALFRNRGERNVGFGRLRDLLSRKEWESSLLYRRIARRIPVGDIVYLWIRCAPDDLWAVALRRKKDEGDFTPYECELIQEFGDFLYGLRNKWYVEKKQVLTDREQEVASEIEKGRTTKEGAGNLCISPATFDKHVENILRKLKIHNRNEIRHRLSGQS